MFFGEKDAQQIVSDELRKRGSEKVSEEGLSSLLGKAKSLIVNKVNRQTENIKNNIQQPEEESIESQLENTAGVGRELTEEELRKKQEEKKEIVKEKPDYITQTIKTLENYNLPIDAIAGIMGNILVEAPTADPKTIEKTTKKDKGRGLFQYSTGTDKKGALPFYKDYLEENNLQDSLENQIGFAMKEIMNPRESKWLGYNQANKLKKLLQKGNVSQVTKGFLKIFEKPKVEHLQRRLDNASTIYQRLINEQGERVENLMKKQTGGMVEKDPYKRQPRFI